VDDIAGAAVTRAYRAFFLERRRLHSRVRYLCLDETKPLIWRLFAEPVATTIHGHGMQISTSMPLSLISSA